MIFKPALGLGQCVRLTVPFYFKWLTTFGNPVFEIHSVCPKFPKSGFIAVSFESGLPVLVLTFLDQIPNKYRYADVDEICQTLVDNSVVHIVYNDVYVVTRNEYTLKSVVLVFLRMEYNRCPAPQFLWHLPGGNTCHWNRHQDINSELNPENLLILKKQREHQTENTLPDLTARNHYMLILPQ